MKGDMINGTNSKYLNYKELYLWKEKQKVMKHFISLFNNQL